MRARTLWSRTSQSKARRSLPTPLTQQHRREAKGHPSFPTVDAFGHAADAQASDPELENSLTWPTGSPAMCT